MSDNDHDLDFAAMSPEELHILAEDHELEVDGTGANGNVLKKDLIAALEAAHPAPGDAGSAIERETRIAWWCPICDRSNTQLTAACGGCGAHRDGDVVRAAA